MKTGQWAVVCAAFFAAGILVPSANAQESAPTTRSEQSGASLAGGTPINAELNASIDSKKAKPGDAVTAHTTGAVKSADDRTILPKGTKLIGHITQASARSKGDGDSTIGIGFDKAILKGGEEVPLNVTIQALAPPRATTMPEMSPAPSVPSTAPSGTGGDTGMSGNRVPNSPSGSAGSYPRPDSGSYPRPDYGGASPNAGGEGTGELPPNSRGVYGLQGVQLMVPASNHAQVSLISSNGKNVHLDSGTRLLLVTQTLASGAPGQR